MERRDFLKISALAGGAAALDACGSPDHHLIRFAPEEKFVPGVAEWRPSVCRACSAGCGVLARVMEGDAEVVRHGEHGLIRMGLAKKLEGNPDHPISRGKLCARGQAGLQITYHPDRVKTPLARAGPRGSGQFTAIGWEEALSRLVAELRKLSASGRAGGLAFLAGPLAGLRRTLVERFLAGYGAPPPIVFAPFEDAVLRQANWRSFGRYQLPSFDLARANTVISFGADFLGTWNSPVAQSVAYGALRRGRPEIRGRFVQVEPRMSQTGANADEWIPARPGTEGALALSLAHVILNGNLLPGAGGSAAALIAGWGEGLPAYSPEAVEKITGVAGPRIVRLANELAAHPPAVAMVAGAPLAQTNGLATALAVNALNELLGSVGRPGGLFFTPEPPAEAFRRPALSAGSGSRGVRDLAGRILADPEAVQAVLVYDANPVFAAPPGWRVREALAQVPFVASFGSFLDETSALGDLILPDHSFLESWVDDVAESGAAVSVASLAPPAMRPLHQTRSIPDVLLGVANELGGRAAAALPWKSYDAMLEAAFAPLAGGRGSVVTADPDEFWKLVQEQGGWWGMEAKPAPALPRPRAAPAAFAPAEFDGEPGDYPFYFLPYASQQFLDGSLAHLPWLQELPDVLSTAMWGAWVEIHPQTAARLGISQGDLVEVASRHGSLRAPALLSPGIAPDVLAMPAGQGHENFTRYASGRGANPFAVLAPAEEPETGAVAWAATRVKIARAGQGKLILFGGALRDLAGEHQRR
jgi:anaerobic selenocysteine-containing dehydrogenase